MGQEKNKYCPKMARQFEIMYWPERVRQKFQICTRKGWETIKNRPVSVRKK